MLNYTKFIPKRLRQYLLSKPQNYQKQAPRAIENIFPAFMDPKENFDALKEYIF